ncbi:MAG TPA: hypothetical protein PK431_17635 [Chitinophagales bacterium]|nr:hypothetical protein [Chitinophagales bacterium]
MKKIFASILALLLLQLQTFAVVPEAIKYQAVARDNGGNILANKNIGIRLSILKGNISGTAVYVETHATSSNNLGLINLEIGKGTPITGTMSAINWGNDSYFIKIEMDETGGTNYTLVGTSQLVSVPYALYAKEAENGTQWSDNDTNIYYNTGNVGIGTNKPRKKLEVYSSERRGSQIQITGEVPTLRLADTAYTGGVVFGVAEDSNDLIPRSGRGDVVFTNEAYGTGGGYIFGTGVPSQPCVKITDDCKVGIGTDTPTSKLEVNGQIATTSGVKFGDGTVQTTAAQSLSGIFFPNVVAFDSVLVDTVFQDLDLSSIVGNNKAMVSLKITTLNISSYNFATIAMIFLTKGNNSNFAFSNNTPTYSGMNQINLFPPDGNFSQTLVQTDSNGKIQFRNQFRTSINPKPKIKIEVLMYMK